MTDLEAQALRKENAYLKARVAQLDNDVNELSSQVLRLQQTLDHTLARRAVHRPDPLSGGQ